MVLETVTCLECMKGLDRFSLEKKRFKGRYDVVLHLKCCPTKYGGELTAVLHPSKALSHLSPLQVAFMSQLTCWHLLSSLLT